MNEEIIINDMEGLLSLSWQSCKYLNIFVYALALKMFWKQQPPVHLSISSWFKFIDLLSVSVPFSFFCISLLIQINTAKFGVCIVTPIVASLKHAKARSLMNIKHSKDYKWGLFYYLALTVISCGYQCLPVRFLASSSIYSTELQTNWVFQSFP